METYGQFAEWLHVNTYYQAMLKGKVKANLDLSIWRLLIIYPSIKQDNFVYLQYFILPPSF